MERRFLRVTSESPVGFKARKQGNLFRAQMVEFLKYRRFRNGFISGLRAFLIFGLSYPPEDWVIANARGRAYD